MDKGKKDTSPYAMANWLQRVLFLYINPLIKIANERLKEGSALKEGDLFQVRRDMKSKQLINKFILKYAQTKSLWSAGRFVVGSVQYFMVFFYFAHTMLHYSGPIFMKYIIQWLEDDDAQDWIGFALVGGLFIALLIRVIFQQHGYHEANVAKVQTFASFYGSLYKKILEISTPAKMQSETGRILTLFSSDAFTCAWFVQGINWFYTVPLNLITCAILIWLEIGWITLVAFGIIMIGGIFQKCIMTKWGIYRRGKLKYTDERTRYIHEYIEGIRVLKYYAWENFAFANIQRARKGEIRLMFKTQLLSALSNLIAIFIPFLMLSFTLGLHVYLGGSLTVSKAFIIIILFRMMAVRVPLGILAIMTQVAVRTRISAHRLNVFFSSHDKPKDIVKNEGMEEGEILIENGYFAWENKELDRKVKEFKEITERNYSGRKKSSSSQIPLLKRQYTLGRSSSTSLSPYRAKLEEAITSNTSRNLIVNSRTTSYSILKDINLEVKKGEMIGIVGGVGSGKSTLAQAILGEVLKESGIVNVKGKVAYLPQIPWIRNDTIKGNILLGSGQQENTMDMAKYLQVLEDSQLNKDLQILEHGDQTEIGSKGINLSGGQKQRISIARAIYSGAHIYIIDDCLSALDSHVSQSIFENVILGNHMNSHTRIFITHAIHLLANPNVNRILVIKDGEIVEQGNYTTLMAKQGEFARLSLIEPESLENEDSEKELDYSFDIDSIYLDEMRDAEEGNNIGVMTEMAKDIEEDAGDKLYMKTISSLKLRKLRSSQSMQLGKRRELVSPLKKRQNTSFIDVKREEIGIIARERHRIGGENKVKGRLIEEEKMERGRVKCSNYCKIIKFGGSLAAALVLFFYCLFAALEILIQWWLGIWSVNEYDQNTLWYFKYFFLIGLGMSITVLIRGIVLAYFLKHLSQSCQMHLIHVLLRSPLSWFDITPTGRILNRAIKDQLIIDEEFPPILASALLNTVFVTAALLLICFISPYFIIITVIMIILYVFWYSKAIQYGRDTRRIESMSKSPIFSIFEETLEGLISIRVCGLEGEFMKKMEEQLNKTHRAFFANVTGIRWMNLRLELLGSCAVALVALLVVLSKGEIGSNMAALSIVNALVISSSLGFMLTSLGNLEIKMASMERMMEYIEKNPQEKPLIYDSPRVEIGWPSQGRIEVNDLSLKYLNSPNLIIKGISFVCEAAQKVGVVGRTGSGKTTLTLGLLRILEPISSTTGPHIIIDGVDVSQIGLHELREQIVYIPQEPVLFSGTVQTNLDPFHNMSFQDKINALRVTTLLALIKKKIHEEKKDMEEEKMNDKLLLNLDDNLYKMNNMDEELTDSDIREILEYEVGEGGSNFSLGERQLICLARAISRKPKVLLMDEATASIDEATDNTIQEMLSTQFNNITTITIAHRLKTIIHYDKILVLADGIITDFDTPINLIRKNTGIFYELIKESGDDFMKEMTNLAVNKD